MRIALPRSVFAGRFWYFDTGWRIPLSLCLSVEIMQSGRESGSLMGGEKKQAPATVLNVRNSINSGWLVCEHSNVVEEEIIFKQKSGILVWILIVYCPKVIFETAKVELMPRPSLACKYKEITIFYNVSFPCDYRRIRIFVEFYTFIISSEDEKLFRPCFETRSLFLSHAFFSLFPCQQSFIVETILKFLAP